MISPVSKASKRDQRKREKNKTLYTGDKTVRYTNYIDPATPSVDGKFTHSSFQVNLTTTINIDTSQSDTFSHTVSRMPSSSVTGSKIGLRKGDGNISELQTPTKGERRFRNTKNDTQSSKTIGGESVKLVSYAQRRTQYKRKMDNSLSQSIEGLERVTQKEAPNRTTFGITKDLRTLREAKKAKRAAMMKEEEDDDLEREEMLFGGLETFDNRDSLQQDSRNTNLYRNTVQPIVRHQDSNNELLSYNEDTDSGADFDVGIDEHDDIITPKTVEIKHNDFGKSAQREMPAVLKRALLTPNTELEVIKETEDINPSPNKPQTDQEAPKAIPEKLTFQDKGQEIQEQKAVTKIVTPSRKRANLR